jgi:hypothetical protein
MAESRDDLAARIVGLEQSVEALQRDLAQLRQELVRPAPVARGPASVAAPAAPARRAPEPVTAVPVRALPDLETLVGRYGMLALATVLTLTAFGTFAGWAVKHGLLGPVPRLVLGLIAAAGLGAWGVWLRPRERSFGDSLLGLSLAAIHVCSWAAGPGLHLVPPFLALALSAVASVALAGFALVQDDEPLWCVGFGGAAIAPFVTSTGQGTAPMLAAYAAAVLIAAGSAMGSRPWTIASRVFGAASALFVLALTALPRAQHSAELALALPFAVAGLGVMPFARGEAVRPRLRTLGLLACAAALFFASGWQIERAAAAAIVAAAGVAWLVLVELTDSEPAGRVLDGLGRPGTGFADWLDGAIIPAGFLVAVGAALDLGTDTAASAFAVASAVLVFFCSRREGAVRDASALVAFAAALAAVLCATHSSLQLQCAGTAAVCVAFVLLERAVPNRVWAPAALLALTVAGVAAIYGVAERPSYQYVPFLTSASAVALAVAVAAGVLAWLSRGDAALALAALFTFAWINEELAYAVSPSVSTLLLVTWYAATGVASVGLGRHKRIPRLRHIGLGLAAIAAALAMRAAWGLSATGARIGAYLVVSAFLLGIAWWYRRSGPAPDSSTAAPESAASATTT